MVEDGADQTQHEQVGVDNQGRLVENVDITDIHRQLPSSHKGRIVAVAGKPQADTTQLPLIYHGEVIGLLLLAPRASGERFSPKDERLLGDLARQVAIAVHAMRVTIDLQRAREQLVTDIEEERCRIRDDLHNSLLSRVTNTIRIIEQAIDVLYRSPEQSEVLMRLAVETAVDASALARSLIYEIRPPVLELGLGYALADLAEQSQHPGLRIYVDIPPHLPPLHPAIEGAVYRIVQAALSNVVEHAQAHLCHMHLSMGDMLNLEIIDDGCGIQPGVKPGIGLTMMRKRAEQLRGSCTIELPSHGGTAIRIRLPVLLKNKRLDSDTITNEEVGNAS